VKTPARLRLWVVAALAFALAAGVVWWVSNRVRGTVRLPDGREVTILAVTYGTNHVLIEGPLWAKVARRFVSRPRAHQLGLRIYERKFSEPTLVIWTHWRLPSTNEAPRYASLQDRHGVESEPEHVAIDAPVGKTGTAIMAWQSANFPRQQSEFSIRFYERVSGQLQFLGQSHVPNVARVRAPSASAASPPASVKQDDLTFTLSRLRSGGEVATNLIRPFFQVAKWAEARFEVHEEGHLATNWFVRNLRAVGETGNRFQPVYAAVPSTNGDLRVAFPDVLWPDEPGWRIRGEFVRNADFPETNRWMLFSIPAVRNSPPFSKQLSQELPGLRIDAVELRPTTQPVLARPVRGGFRRTTDLTVVHTALAERMHVALIAVTDDLGRGLRFNGGSESMQGRYVVGLEVMTNSTTLDLTFVVHQGREVEFFVKPDWAWTNTPPH
jgi:hypothetical protein